MHDGLNSAQREAVHHLDGPLLVLAGAGSGKTRVITHKIAWLIESGAYASQHIAAITFTNKAAEEMRQRLGAHLSGKNIKGLTVATFHALGLQILRREAPLLGYKSKFSVLDAADAQHVLTDILKTTDKAVLRRVQSRISHWKNALQSPEKALADAQMPLDVQDASAYQSYQKALKAYQAMDFDDLIRLPTELLQGNETVLTHWRKALRYVLVDEYQDTNACQYAMIRLLCGVSGALTAVGDDDQAIYGWRGAEVGNLRQLHTDFPRLRVVQLTQNYRSTTHILQAANSVIAHNERLYDKKLWSEAGSGDTVTVLCARDDSEEARQVVMRLSAHRFERRARYGDYAILYRGNHQSRLLEQMLREEKIPYIISGGVSFFERTEIKDILAYLRLVSNEDDDPAFIRALTTPRRGVGAQTLEKLGEYAGKRQISLFAAVFEAGLQAKLEPAQHGPLLMFCQYINRLQSNVLRLPAGELLAELLRDIQYEAWLFDHDEVRAAQSRWERVQEFVGWLTRKGENDKKNLLELVQTIALMSLLEGQEGDEVDAVRLSTIHAAKGLEFGHVFLVGLEDGILPHREAVENGSLEEERRLMYVAITRAQRSLTLSYCQRRKRGGEWQVCEPSRFLAEIDPATVKRTDQNPTDPAQARQQGAARLAQLKAMLRTNEVKE